MRVSISDAIMKSLIDPHVSAIVIIIFSPSRSYLSQNKTHSMLKIGQHVSDIVSKLENNLLSIIKKQTFILENPFDKRVYTIDPELISKEYS